MKSLEAWTKHLGSGRRRAKLALSVLMSSPVCSCPKILTDLGIWREDASIHCISLYRCKIGNTTIGQSGDPSAIQAIHTALAKAVTIATATELLLLETRPSKAIGSEMRISGRAKEGRATRFERSQKE